VTSECATQRSEMVGRATRAALATAASALALLAFASAAPAASFPATPASLGPIPDGAPGPGCAGYGAEKLVAFDVTGVASPITNVAVSMTFNPAHTWVGDLSVELIAPGFLAPTQFIFHRTITSNPSDLGDASNAAGPYLFSDAAPPSPSWWEAALATDAAIAIPSGTYRASTPGEITGGGANTLFSPTFAAATPNGAWTLRFRDKCETVTGAVSAATLFLNEVAPPATPPASTSQPPGVTGKRAAALKKCKEKKAKSKRRKCRKRARRLPV
jgi:hypothetical protein